ncbi:hypothetical protein BCR42DRAFT_408588 [Absidia repens]|uniref:Uncharacterized protein n=1 Tax=Absidia repens TaxID=90262 RepID=A0A1X2IPY1_9FUNG|nr:hypothetical protein BCR42DRAFT_408588 [Absidia repens]
MFLVWDGDMPVGLSDHTAILDWIGQLVTESTLLSKAVMDLQWVAFFFPAIFYIPMVQATY